MYYKINYYTQNPITILISMESTQTNIILHLNNLNLNSHIVIYIHLESAYLKELHCVISNYYMTSIINSFILISYLDSLISSQLTTRPHSHKLYKICLYLILIIDLMLLHYSNNIYIIINIHNNKLFLSLYPIKNILKIINNIYSIILIIISLLK